MMSRVVPADDGHARWPERLPVPLTDFIGRAQERAEVAQLLSSARLVTLVGAGGVGKTRLALEAAATAAPGSPTALTWSIWKGCRERPSLLALAVARSLQLEERDQTATGRSAWLASSTRSTVGGHPRQLRAPAPRLAEMVAWLLGLCPQLVVLATSRNNLGVPGEVTWRVPSLTFPWPEAAV